MYDFFKSNKKKKISLENTQGEKPGNPFRWHPLTLKIESEKFL